MVIYPKISKTLCQCVLCY